MNRKRRSARLFAPEFHLGLGALMGFALGVKESFEHSEWTLTVKLLAPFGFALGGIVAGFFGALLLLLLMELGDRWGEFQRKTSQRLIQSPIKTETHRFTLPSVSRKCRAARVGPAGVAPVRA